MMKRSQTKKISAVLAAMAVLWGGSTLFFGGDSVSAADYVDWEKNPTGGYYRVTKSDVDKYLKKILDTAGIKGTNQKETEVRNWFIKTLQTLYRPFIPNNPSQEVPNSFWMRFDSQGEYTTTNTLHFAKRDQKSVDIGEGNIYIEGGTGDNSESIYGTNNFYTRGTYIFGNQNIAMGDHAITVGRDNRSLGKGAVVMGFDSYAGVEKGNDGNYTDVSGSVALGNRAWAGSKAISMGNFTLSMGSNAIAIGNGARAGFNPEELKKMQELGDAVPIRSEIPEAPWSYATLIVPTSENLMKVYPEFFDASEYNDAGKPVDAFQSITNLVMEKYKKYFDSMGIKYDSAENTPYEQLKRKMVGEEGNTVAIIEKLAWQYALEHSNIESPTALGDEAAAYGNHSLALGYKSTVGFGTDGAVALGANSLVTFADMDEVNSSLKGKAPFSGITLRQSGNLGSDGNANGEYLTGAISIGGPRYVQKEVDGKMQTVQEGNYIRQIKHLADGTDPTDAINLRQLQGLETKLSQGNTSPKTFALAGDIGMTKSDKMVANKTITKELGNTINIVGGVVAKTDAASTDNNDATAGNGEATTPATTPTITEVGLTDNNIGVVSDGEDTLTIKLANTLKGITSIEGEVEANGKLSFTTDALTLTRTTGGTTASIIMGTQEATPGIHLSFNDTKVRVDANGLDVGSKQIHSVQSGMATSASHTDSETSDSTTSSGDTDTNNESNGNKEGSTAPSYTLAVSKLADNDTRLTNAANIGDLRTAAQGLEEKINDLDISFNTTVNGLKPITVMGDKEVKNTDGSLKYPNGVITTEAVKDSNNKITGYIVKADLSAYAKTSILNQYITQEDLKNYIDQSTLDAKLEKYAKLDASNLTDENNIKAWKEKLGVTAPPEVKGGSLDYSANGDNKQTIDLDKDGLNFVDGTNTTATVGANGEVKYDLKSNLTGIESIKGKDNTKGELKFTAEGAELSHQTNFGNSSLSVGDAIKATVGTNSLTVGNSIEAKSGSNSFTLGSNDLKATVGQAHMTIDKEKWETVFNDATSTIMKDASITTTAGKSTLALSDTTSTLTVGTKETGSTVMNQTTDKVAWTVTGKSTDGKSAPTTTISITAEGLDVGKTIIHNLADGEALTDAATVGQLTTAKEEFNTHFTKLDGDVVNLQNSMNGMNTRITKLDRRVDKVGAGAAALAALHPLDFDPGNKWDIAGGYGHYAGQSAMALGAYYRPNEDVMFSIGGAFGNGEDMINAGVSVKVGSGESKTTTSKAAMAKKINELQQVVTTQHQQLEEQKANMAKQDAKIAAQENEIKELKAIMQQILAK